jgi:hypothetical protein
VNHDRGDGAIILPSGRKVYLREWAFVAPSQVGRAPTGKIAGPWRPLIGDVDKVLQSYRWFRKWTRRQSRWYRRNQVAIQARRRRDPNFHIGKGADWPRLYPHGRRRILAWREVR